MIQDQYIKPGPKSSFLVERFLLLSVEGTGSSIRDRFIPDGRTGIVFHFSGGFKAVRGTESIDLPALFYTKPMKSSLLIDVHPPADSMIAICYTSVFSKFFGIDMGSNADGLFFQFEDTGLIRNFEGVLKAGEPGEQITVFENILSRCGDGRFAEPDLVDKVYKKIISGKGTESVSEIAEQFSIHPRTLHRKFQKRIGIPPKALLNLVRVHYIWSQILKNPGLDAFDMVCEGKFYDQPHFIRDFRKIVGETPKAFFRRNQEIARALSARG